MGTAFAATLTGLIFGGVIVRLIYTCANDLVDHLVAHIAEIAEVHILTVLRDAARERSRANKRAAARISPVAIL